MEKRTTKTRDSTIALARELGRILAPEQVFTEGPALRQGLQDGTGNRGVIGTADALVEPQSTEETAAVLAWWCDLRAAAGGVEPVALLD